MALIRTGGGGAVKITGITIVDDQRAENSGTSNISNHKGAYAYVSPATRVSSVSGLTLLADANTSNIAFYSIDNDAASIVRSDTINYVVFSVE